ncbi:uncharacterized protein LOC135399861 [Ornithodoros turicata]|uniref:uncharacterized protein LOC135399861 n=1 Tax=Ornithodoros turicata TaxID=34597 RepID=UPI003138CA91
MNCHQLTFTFVLCIVNFERAWCCTRPEATANAGEFYSSGTINGTFPRGTTVTYVCDPFYLLLGEKNRTCTADGTWHPHGTPYCLKDVAINKKMSMSSTVRSSSIKGTVRSCAMTEVQHSPWWFVDLGGLFHVQVINVSLYVRNAASVVVQFRVGQDHPNKSTNPLCSILYNVEALDKPVYFSCVHDVVGRYVSAHVHSASPVSLGVCSISVYSDHYVPLHIRREPVTYSEVGDHKITIPAATGIILALFLAILLIICGVVNGFRAYHDYHSAKKSVSQASRTAPSTEDLTPNLSNPDKAVGAELRSVVYTSSLSKRDVKTMCRKIGRSVFTISESELRNVQIGHYKESPLL